VEALFGGSFDPVHLGHLIAAEMVADALDVTIRFVPTREQPLKRTAHAASPKQRAAMLELAIAGNTRFRVDRVELGLPAPSYTVRTLRTLAERGVGNRFALLLGADAARELAHWSEVEALPDLADVIVFSRPGADFPEHPAIRKRVTIPTLDVSATAIRERIAAGRSIQYLVPDAVREYIVANGLYR
jgi:nicotinate-nucleotide adenylyltransferase